MICCCTLPLVSVTLCTLSLIGIVTTPGFPAAAADDDSRLTKSSPSPIGSVPDLSPFSFGTPLGSCLTNRFKCANSNSPAFFGSIKRKREKRINAEQGEVLGEKTMRFLGKRVQVSQEKKRGTIDHSHVIFKSRS